MIASVASRLELKSHQKTKLILCRMLGEKRERREASGNLCGREARKEVGILKPL